MPKKEPTEPEATLHIRLPAAKLAQYKALAAAEERSLSQWVRWHLDQIARGTKARG